MRGTDLKLMLDSGAYTAWKQGTPIKLKDYIDFILETKDVWTTVVNLDMIPGKPNQPVTPAEAERAAEIGWENYLQLKEALAPYGITPLHVFHRGENFKWLEKLVKESEYIGLAPKTDGGTAVKMTWLDRCMKYVTDDKGWPIRKLHGFAITAPELIRRFPWYSVDSASWIWAGKDGGCLIPGYGKVLFSAASSFRSDAGKHFDAMPRLDREAIARYLARKRTIPRMLRDDYCLTCGIEFTWRRACCSDPNINNAQRSRDTINIEYYLAIQSAAGTPWGGRSSLVW